MSFFAKKFFLLRFRKKINLDRFYSQVFIYAKKIFYNKKIFYTLFSFKIYTGLFSVIHFSHFKFILYFAKQNTLLDNNNYVGFVILPVNEMKLK